MKYGLGKSLCTVLVVALAGLAAFGCSDDSTRIKFVTGPQGGSWYPLGGAIKNRIEGRIDGISVQVLPGAGVANVKAVESGKAQIGLANSVSTVDGINGKPPFDVKATHVCNVATLYQQFFQVVTRADSGSPNPSWLRARPARYWASFARSVRVRRASSSANSKRFAAAAQSPFAARADPS